jgi:hypothetical protein
MKMCTLSALVTGAVLAGMSGAGLAQADNNDKSADFTADFAFGSTELSIPACNDLNCAYLFRCNSSQPLMVVSVADCCIDGDIWRADITNGVHIETTSNQDDTGVAFAPGIFSEEVGVYGKTAFVMLSGSNPIPGGFVAGLYATVRSLGAAPNCELVHAEPDGPIAGP